MKRIYVVSKDKKSGLWYAHMAGFPWIPVWGSCSKSKIEAQKVAANMMCLSLKEYLQLRL
ncbi:hypothetical protein [Calorimonas adulescens]|uniref:Uncharacterized protein n=1 Tax=Calorimonas adulescens TaxID=2606906 RepID=A0A5D8QBK1_9THEO|nr:hypothetical protein [Calorimonas adulescens]TZE81990.1 hypothetical protein FWJ32_07075 [Calorimonas adulescens]